MSRVLASLFVAGLVGMIAHDAGVPFWRTFEPGDVADLMAASFGASWFAIDAMRARLGPKGVRA